MPTYLGDTHTFTSRSNKNNIVIRAGANEVIDFDSTIQYGPHIQLIHELVDLPDPIAGVITLEDNKTYHLLESIDLLGSRIVCGVNSAFMGTSINSNSALTSTGLGIGVPLITTISNFASFDVNYYSVDTLFSCDGGGTSFQISIQQGVITDVPTIGTIQGYSFINFQTIGFINCSKLTFDGTNNVVSMFNCSYNNTSVDTSIIVPATAIILGRIKLITVVFNTTNVLGTSLNISALATIPAEGYNLSGCNFTGAGIPIVGVLFDDNKAYFNDNTAITNSRAIGSFYTNISAPTIVVLNTWTKILGTTTTGSIISKFTNLIDNRLVYTGVNSIIFSINYAVGIFGGNSKDFKVGISYNGANPTVENSTISITDSAGKIANISSRAYILLNPTDFIELWIRNDTDATNLTASNMTIHIDGY